MFRKIISITLLIFSLEGCHMKTDEIDYKQFLELHKHEGSENYEVSELFNMNYEIRSNLIMDLEKNDIIVYGYQKLKLEKSIYYTRHFSNLGDEISEIDNSYKTLKDGTIWGSSFYINWNINGDTTRHKYLDPFTNKKIDDALEFETKEKDAEKWLEKFKNLYDNASYIYESSWNYYFKVEEKWYFLKYNLEVINDNFVKNNPPKEDQDVRMVELEDLAPKFYRRPEETDLIKVVGYESTYEEEVDKGIFSYGFSAGWWYLEVYMPLGDTIRIKRYSNFKAPDIQLYKVPAEYGGREDVLFIVQKPEELFPEQVGGMYAIRPRDPKQPQRRYKKIVYKTDKDGAEVIDMTKSVETEEYKLWVKG